MLSEVLRETWTMFVQLVDMHYRDVIEFAMDMVSSRPLSTRTLVENKLVRIQMR
jgi:hypothetical protein